MKLARLSRRFRTSPMRLGAHPGALLQIRMCAEAALPMETGGILIGYRTVRAIVVTEIAEVPDPNATARTYNRDQRVAQQLLDERLACEPQSSALGYVGEWHSHLCDLTASPTDGSTLRRNALADGDSIALIVTRRTTQGWDESGYVSSRPWLRWRPIVSVRLLRVPIVVFGAASVASVRPVTIDLQGPSG